MTMTDEGAAQAAPVSPDETVTVARSEFEDMKAQLRLVTRLLSEQPDPDKQKQHQAEWEASHPIDDKGTEMERLMRSYNAQPKVTTFLPPTDDERKVAMNVPRELWQGDQPPFPPRMHAVNGVVFALEVGKQITVPESVASELMHESTFTSHVRRAPISALNVLDPTMQGGLITDDLVLR